MISRRQFFKITAGAAAATIAAPLVPAAPLKVLPFPVQYAVMGPKPKIDVNVQMMQIQKMLGTICKHLNVELPPDVLAYPQKG
jgi:anaerobic selenocysteine-containing dehydrogenase